MAICQIALSTLDLDASIRFYRDGLGLLDSGRTRLFGGRLGSRLLGLPAVRTQCAFLLDWQEFVQLELFSFNRPKPRRRPPIRSAATIGYQRIGIEVADLERSVDSIARLGLPGPPPRIVSSGRALATDPDGNPVELFAEDPRTGPRPPPHRPAVGSALRSITASVGDLERSRRFFVETLGLRPTDCDLHSDAEEGVLSAIDGSQRRTLVLDGGPILVELHQYLDPAPGERPTGHRICDQGILNVALGFRSKREFEITHEAVLDGGYRCNSAPLNSGFTSSVYTEDDQQFSVELLYRLAGFDRIFGFAPPGDWRAWWPFGARSTISVISE